MFEIIEKEKVKKIPVAILGATGMVGQKFIELLIDHPLFEIVALGASERSEGKSYREAANWLMNTPLPERIAKMTVQGCSPLFPCKIVFSGLDSSVAGEVETAFAREGYVVISNSKNHRMDPDVPLLIPEVNYEHLELVKSQSYPNGGMIVTNPNCSVVGLAMALKPLDMLWGVETVHVTTMQALSGAGYPGVASLDIIDNVIPYISGEEEKLETEPQKIMGRFGEDGITYHPMTVGAHCNRVPVVDGHMECVSVKLAKNASAEQIIEAWRTFIALPQQYKLPFAPENPIFYFDEVNFPQPRRHRNLQKGMAVAIGRLRTCPIHEWKFVVLSHNTIRGAAGGAILNAEALVYEGYIK